MVYEDNNPGIFEFKEKEDELAGTLIKIQSDVGPSDSMLYTLEVEGKPINVWGTTILDQRMVGIKVGDQIKMIFKGLGEAKAGKNAPKLFQVLVDRPLKDTQPKDPTSPLTPSGTLA